MRLIGSGWHPTSRRAVAAPPRVPPPEGWNEIGTLDLFTGEEAPNEENDTVRCWFVCGYTHC